MGLHESRGKIAGVTKDLFSLWENTKLQWDDAISRELEESLLRPLEVDMRNATSAMDRMAVLLSRVRRECE